MDLAVVIVILIIWAVIGIKERIEDWIYPSYPVKDWNEEIKILSQFNTQKERQKFLKRRRKEYAREMWRKSKEQDK